MSFIAKLIRSSRWLILFGVFTSFVASIALFVATFISFVMNIYQISQYGMAFDDNGIKQLAVTLMNYVDLFFIAAAFYLISAGLYKLFIDENIKLPAAISVNSFDDLKKILIRVAIVVLTILFLEKAIKWEGGWEIAGFGFACAFVIIAITFNITSDEKVSLFKQSKE